MIPEWAYIPLATFLIATIYTIVRIRNSTKRKSFTLEPNSIDEAINKTNKRVEDLEDHRIKSDVIRNQMKENIDGLNKKVDHVKSKTDKIDERTIMILKLMNGGKR